MRGVFIRRNLRRTQRHPILQRFHSCLILSCFFELLARRKRLTARHSERSCALFFFRAAGTRARQGGICFFLALRKWLRVSPTKCVGGDPSYKTVAQALLPAR